jgi:hypothetical protein
VIPVTGKGCDCLLISTLANRGTLRFMVFTQRFCQPLMIDFLHRLIRASARKLFLIIGGHSVHRGRQVAPWLNARRARFFAAGLQPSAQPR